MTTHVIGTAPPDPIPIASTIPLSWLHETFYAAEEEERRTGREVAKLHVGEPYFDPPEEVAEALVAAVRRGETGYSSAEGLLELREALVAKLNGANGLDTSVSHVFVSPGSCQGLASLLRSIAEPGAEILLPALHWPVHLQQSLLVGLRPAFYALGADYRPDVDAILAAASPATRVLLLNSPANPTGVVLDTETISTLLNLARTRGWQIVSDEAYEHYVFDGDHLSVATMERDVPDAERIVHSTFSFSKSLAMTGYRLGYVVAANKRTARTLRVVQEASIIGPSTPVQYAGIAAMCAISIAGRHCELVKRNRDKVLPDLVAAGLLSELPAGGWYALVDIGCSGLDAETFAARLLKSKHVAVVPGTGFALRPTLDATGAVRSIEPEPWAHRLVRLAFCVGPQVLEHGVSRLLDFVGECAG
jgi:aspartate aminotransferase